MMRLLSSLTPYSIYADRGSETFSCLELRKKVGYFPIQLYATTMIPSQFSGILAGKPLGGSKKFLYHYQLGQIYRELYLVLL